MNAQSNLMDAADCLKNRQFATLCFITGISVVPNENVREQLGSLMQQWFQRFCLLFPLKEKGREQLDGVFTHTHPSSCDSDCGNNWEQLGTTGNNWRQK